ncbi:MAG: TerC family protein [Myxococcales bacterium]|nr:TerC family protein [Myxococcales bacterium]MCB9553720.1 TerC family protein [Myxococcales bacterium]
MEIVLGIDNIVFITILCGRLPPEKQVSARRLGLAAALITRIILLLSITWVMTLTEPLFELWRPWSGKDLILLFGGLFLIYKATVEIHENINHPDKHAHPEAGEPKAGKASYGMIIGQIMLLDIVFSLDSVITAVGMAQHIPVMIAAVLIAVGVMMAFAGPIGDFVQRNATIRVLALAFLVLIGGTLLMEGTGVHVSKGYIYSAMGFSLLVEVLNMRMRSRRGPHRLPEA